MAISNRKRVGKVLGYLKIGLGPFRPEIVRIAQERAHSPTEPAQSELL